MIFPRTIPPISPRLIRVFFVLASGALLLLVLSYWAGQYFSPRVAARPLLSLPSPPEAAQTVKSRHLFGQSDPAEAAKIGQAVISSTVRVLGVASSGPSGSGFAIVSIDGKPPVPAVDGQEFAPGFQLVRVTKTGIEYHRNGVLQRAELQPKKMGSANAPGIEVQRSELSAHQRTLPTTPNASSPQVNPPAAPAQ